MSRSERPSGIARSCSGNEQSAIAPLNSALLAYERKRHEKKATLALLNQEFLWEQPIQDQEEY
ncbi:MAG: hypothetical protein GVY04_10405 [Cyanobacteria bacterium]|jgi:hypothetical protein|nr:hypothetical protein [Cyanobacteria bacterium GSL.Bin1]